MIALKYSLANKQHYQQFNHQLVEIPLIDKGKRQLLTWGRRERENLDLPVGPYILWSQLKNKQLDSFFPKKVLLPISHYCLSTHEAHRNWFQLVKDQYLLGIIARNAQQERIYIAVIIPQDNMTPYPIWPIVTHG